MRTAVEWLINKVYMIIPDSERNFLEGLKEMAKEMEKDQIINAHGLRYSDITEETVKGEEYYNKTYNQEPKKEYGPSKKYLEKQKELIEDFIWNKMNKNNQDSELPKEDKTFKQKSKWTKL